MRLGISGLGFYWKLSNGTMIIDSMYDIDMYLGQIWTSISLANIAKELDLSNKLDDDYDVTRMMVYSTIDSDLHALAVRTMLNCERLYVLAGITRRTFWDATAGNSGHTVICYIVPVTMSINMTLGVSTVSNSEEREFGGGFVITPLRAATRA